MTITSFCGFVQLNLDKIKYKRIFNGNKNSSNSNSSGSSSSSSNGGNGVVNSKSFNENTITSHKYSALMLIIFNKLCFYTNFWRNMLIVGALR